MRREEHANAKAVAKKVQEVFRYLRKEGYICKSNFECCQSCGWAALDVDEGAKVVFYHRQDAATLKARGHLWLAWSVDAPIIVNAMAAAGLMVAWGGKKDGRIVVWMDKGGDRSATARLMARYMCEMRGLLEQTALALLVADTKGDAEELLKRVDGFLEKEGE